MEHDSGTALDRSLRGIELVVPLTLRSRIDLVADARHRDLEETWHTLLAAALPLVRAVGASRSRGLGRAVLRLEGAS